MTIITFSIVFGNFLALQFIKEYLNHTSWFDFVTVAINGVNAAILAYASWSIRKSILAYSDLKPNQTLVNVHVFNSIAFAFLSLTQVWIHAWALQIEKDPDFQTSSEKRVLSAKLTYFYWLNRSVTDVFNTWMDLFLIYLLFRFTREKQKMIKEHVLGRDVPSIVFINNQRLIKDSCVLRMEQ